MAKSWPLVVSSARLQISLTMPLKRNMPRVPSPKLGRLVGSFSTADSRIQRQRGLFLGGKPFSIHTYWHPGLNCPKCLVVVGTL